MNKNVGKADSYIRFLVGISFLLNIIILSPGILGTLVLLVLGLSMIVTAYTGFCWLYSVLKVSSCPQECSTDEAAQG